MTVGKFHWKIQRLSSDSHFPISPPRSVHRILVGFLSIMEAGRLHMFGCPRYYCHCDLLCKSSTNSTDFDLFIQNLRIFPSFLADSRITKLAAIKRSSKRCCHVTAVASRVRLSRVCQRWIYKAAKSQHCSEHMRTMYKAIDWMSTSAANIFRKTERSETKTCVETVHFDTFPQFFLGIFALCHLAIVHHSSAQSIRDARGSNTSGNNLELCEYRGQLLLFVQC